jgi:hypothetical protein
MPCGPGRCLTRGDCWKFGVLPAAAARAALDEQIFLWTFQLAFWQSWEQYEVDLHFAQCFRLGASAPVLWHWAHAPESIVVV